MLCMCARTAQAWLARARDGGLELLARGRPIRRSTVSERNEVIAFLCGVGPSVGLSTVAARFPWLARRELHDLLKRFRRLHRRVNKVLVHELTWTEPGRTWAADFTQTPVPIDGDFTHVLVVRDLAAGVVLLCLPTRGEDAITVCGALEALMAQHGPPLVFKSDNGSGFIARAVGRLLASHDVVHLYSPPRTPSYNGSSEAGMGPLKTRAHYHAARNGRAHAWTSADLEAAQRITNELSRPQGPLGPTPAEVWRSRSAITEAEREAFLAELRSQRVAGRCRERAQRGAPLDTRDKARVERQAIHRALEKQGFLRTERRWIPQPKKR